jgi:hypothetical protein
MQLRMWQYGASTILSFPPSYILLIIIVLYRTRIAGNYHGVQFSQMASLQSFHGLIFVDAGDHAHYTLYNRIYFVGLI